MERLAVGCESGRPGSPGAGQGGGSESGCGWGRAGDAHWDWPGWMGHPGAGKGTSPNFLRELASTEELPGQGACLSWAGPRTRHCPCSPRRLTDADASPAKLGKSRSASWCETWRGMRSQFWPPLATSATGWHMAVPRRGLSRGRGIGSWGSCGSGLGAVLPEEAAGARDGAAARPQHLAQPWPPGNDGGPPTPGEAMGGEGAQPPPAQPHGSHRLPSWHPR